MAYNDRIEVRSGDVRWEQQSPAQAFGVRTEWYPGKAVSRPGDMNWERDNRMPTGTPAFGGEAAGPVEMERVRVTKLGRNIVSDQTVLAPVVTGVRIETRCEPGINGEDTVQDTANPPQPANQERTAGYDWLKGA